MPTKINEVPSQARLRELFDYVDGQLIWKVRPLSEFKSQRDCNIFNARDAGKAAGGIYKYRGYRRINIDYVRYAAHRIVYAYVYGECPADLQIDHINGNKSDNRIENLRLATCAQNQQNVAKKINNTTGFKCVHWDKKAQKFRAYITANGKHKHLGSFNTAQEAAEAYNAAARIHHGDFMHASITEAQP